MTSAEIRQSFLDFFAAHGHTIVPSSSLLPDSPGLLFTNAGMNQFVPIFLGDRKPDVSHWAGVKPNQDTRAADTQKCIRAGGKHNDLEDVGFDTYHHTLFEMLGNWSFGDYFKKDSITWGWELLTKVWGIPPKRLFATVYSPDKTKGDPSDFDQEAHDIWAGIFKKAGLDPAVHIVNGNKKDNFWMMGDTGPCGPCSEIHFNLLPGDNEAEGRKLVNASSPRCIEIWNHVFIQFNANADGTFSPLAAKHVDTGMGFERVAGIHATTQGFKDFSKDPSNYNADVFAPLFKKIAELSGKTYHGTVPIKREGLTEQENIDVAFRVLADHARCVSCAIADGILPSNDGRNYVIRRILRRGILYGKKLGLATGFFEQLVAPVVESLGSVFPELKQQQDIIRRAIRSEEESFGRTLDRGLHIFNEAIRATTGFDTSGVATGGGSITLLAGSEGKIFESEAYVIHGGIKKLSGQLSFNLYDTYGFPLDMTQLLATERGLTVDVAGFEVEMEKQRERGRASQKKEIVVAATEGSEATDQKATKFLGYTQTNAHAQLIEIVRTKKEDVFLVFDQTPFYAEMGGQAGDTGTALINGHSFDVSDTVKDKAGRHLHKLAATVNRELPTVNSAATLAVDAVRRRAISRHHSATHLLHWALRKVLGTHVRQAGTHKTPDRLRFDFSHFEAVTHAQLLEIEQLVNEHVIDNAKVEAYETEFDKKPEGTLAFFGDKYGKIVRVVDIGGFSRELCGGTHVATTGEIGLVKVVAESAIAAGTRRIEAVAGQAAIDFIAHREAALAAVSAHLSAGPADVVKKLETILAHQKELEKKLKGFEQKASAGLSDELAAKATARDGLNFVSTAVAADSPESLRSLGAQILAKLGEGVVVLGAAFGDKATVVAFCSPAAIKAGHQAGKLVNELSLKLGGKGGGKPDFAMGGGRDVAKLAEVLKA
ncbi:MAG TPA: alanine--tRNA ligase [Opitutaceae bacterium]|jgi:alanyl-tRNA synthetase|nr:alanine--tRNA ligase [Opitutaceae bacterium]